MNTKSPRGKQGGVAGLLVVDKPAGWTSHDVVARIRRLADIRRVGHAGTLDPMATGVLLLGIGQATRLLGYLAATDKSYEAVIRLGQTTSTDDAEGEVLATISASHLSDERITAGVTALTGKISQVPPAVSAVKIRGQRAYARVRAGEQVELSPRTVTISRFQIHRRRCQGDFVDLEVEVVCSSGTYIRSLARDLGAALGVGGHLTSLRRTRVGPYTVAMACAMTELDTPLPVLPLAAAVAAAFPRRLLTAEQARLVSHGGRLPAAGLGPGPVGAFGPNGDVLAVVQEFGEVAKPLVVFA